MINTSKEAYVINKLMQEDEADLILLTCTQYIAALGDQQDLFKQPIVPIDEPLFELICQGKGPLQLVFSNPDTVEGTMKRLKSYAKEHGKQIDAEVMVMEDVFHLCLNGDMQAYEEQIKKQTQKMYETKRRYLRDAAIDGSCGTADGRGDRRSDHSSAFST
nr:hypothetical protein [Bacillus pumilus]